MKIRGHAALLIIMNLLTLAHAQDYPAKPIRIVVGFTAGTATDTMARIIGMKLNESWSPLQCVQGFLPHLPHD